LHVKTLDRKTKTKTAHSDNTNIEVLLTIIFNDNSKGSSDLGVNSGKIARLLAVDRVHPWYNNITISG